MRQAKTPHRPPALLLGRSGGLQLASMAAIDCRSLSICAYHELVALGKPDLAHQFLSNSIKC